MLDGMDSELVSHNISQLNLFVDTSTLHSVTRFLNSQVGPLQNLEHDQQVYHIYSALAIVGEEQKLPSISGNGLVHSGLTIEVVMSKLTGLSVQTFINHLEKLTLKCKDASQHLLYKVEQLKIGLRLFSKFKKLVGRLMEKMPGKMENLQEDLVSLIWELYVIMKHKNTTLDIEEQTKTLIQCLVYIARKLEIEQQMLDREMVSLEFPGDYEVADRSISDYATGLIEETTVGRYHEFNLPTVFMDENKRQRLLDDLRIHYESHRNLVLPVDEVKFLKLPKSLTPLKKAIATPVSHRFMKKLNFESLAMEEDGIEIEDNNKLQIPIDYSKFQTSQLLSPLLTRRTVPNRRILMSPCVPKPELTPYTAKTKDSQWMSLKVTQLDSSKQHKLQELFQEVGPTALQETEAYCLEILERILGEKSESTGMIQVRKLKILHFFKSTLIKLCCQNLSLKDPHILLSETKFLKAVLCIVTYIFFYSNSLPFGQFKDLASKFVAHYVDLVNALNQVCKCDCTMPPSLKHHLKTIQTTILICYVWEDGTAVKVMQTPPEDVYSTFFINKLQQAIYWRISEISKGFEKYETSIRELVSHILNERLYLLNRNCIDQIILCATQAILNKQSQQSSIEQLFKSYSNLPNSFQEYRQKVYSEQTVYTLEEFYDKIFLPAVGGFMEMLPINVTGPQSTPTFTIKVITDNGCEVCPAKIDEGMALRWKKRLIGGLTKNKESDSPIKTSNTSPKLARNFSFSKESPNGDNSNTFGFQNKPN